MSRQSEDRSAGTTVEQVIEPDSKDLGGFSVLRVLPAPSHRQGLWLTRITHRFTAADAAKRTVASCTPDGPLNVVVTTPSRTSGPCSSPQRLFDALGNCSDTSDRCIALLRGAGPLHIHVHIAT
ncbi:MAG: hypothetical protein GY785_13935 [Gammaproteobacteria bacterium]|nr:hypothetical protein [Gammaproteobacteria bacterium]